MYRTSAMYSKKNKVAKKKNELPMDLMMEIAQRLCVKSIGRFKCASKQWNLFFCSPGFVKSHLQRAPERIILLDHVKHTPHLISLATDVSGSSRAVQSPMLEDIEEAMLLGCCNGLALLRVKKYYDRRRSLVLINPVTRTASIVREYDIPMECKRTLGFGIVKDDYKIVLCWTPIEPPVSTNVLIFSLKTGTWKELVADYPYDLHMNHGDFGVYTDGCLHWMADSYSTSGSTHRDIAIMAFDLPTEKFEKMSPPWSNDFKLHQSKNAHLKVLGGCLAISCHNADDIRSGMAPIDFWIMEERGSWRKFSIDNDPWRTGKCGICYYDVVCRLGEFEFVLQRIQDKLYEFAAYNCETGVWRYLDIDDLPQRFEHVWIFRESLVCP